MTYRDSFNSTGSTNTYPSTMSLHDSALGLSDSPRSKTAPSVNSSASSSSPVPSPVRRAIRPSQSRTSLQQEATVNAARLAQRSADPMLLKPVSEKSSRSSLKEVHPSQPSSRGPSPTQSSTARASPTRPAVSSAARASSHSAATAAAAATDATAKTATKAPAQTPVPNQTRAPPARQTRPSQAQPARTSPQKLQLQQQQQRAPSPPSPARSDVTFAEEWEAELIRNAKQLNLNGSTNLATRPSPLRQAPTKPTESEKETQRQRDQEWERSGLWEGNISSRDAGDRTRRDTEREIAYPPSMPRLAVRAAPSGVTTVHIGVRPRLHPSRASDSMLRNQPDTTVPEPLFSPAHANAELPGDSVRGSYNQHYDTALLDKAKKEYEDWLARKAEREGGIAGDEGGTRDWVPSNRQVARPGAVDGLAHSDGYVPAKEHLTPYPYPAAGGYGQPTTPQEHSVQYPAEYWDPSYWWGMGEEGEVQMVTADTANKKPQVQFAERSHDDPAAASVAETSAGAGAEAAMDEAAMATAMAMGDGSEQGYGDM